MKRGILITFEGPEGSGKTTQIRRLAAFLRGKRKSVLVTREPGGSKLSTHLRRWILDKLGYRLAAETELFLFLADRAQHVQEVIRPALAKGWIVLCDRYTDSTLAYQGGGRGFDLGMLRSMNRTATGGLSPEVTVLFDVPVEMGLARASSRGRGKDRMEREKVRFHRKVLGTFRILARKEPGRFLVIDARKGLDHVFEGMMEGLRRKAVQGSSKVLREVFRG